MDAFSVEADVPGGPDAATSARRIVRDELRGRVSPRHLADVALLVTELVANGVRHGGAGPGAVLQLRLEVGPRSVRVEVVDPGGRHSGVAPRPADIDQGGGLGLQIVERVASRWGVGDEPPTTVWFELDRR